MKSKYALMQLIPNEVRFEVIIVADSNDADYVTTRETFSLEMFEEEIVDELIVLQRDFGGPNELKKMWSEDSDTYLDIPMDSQDEYCHSLEELEITMYDTRGFSFAVKLNLEEEKPRKKRIIMKVISIGSTEWEEELEIDSLEDTKDYAHRVIDNFNATLKPGERPRVLLSVYEK